MNQDPTHNDDAPSDSGQIDANFWRARSDSETDELGLRIAAYAAKRAREEEAKPENAKYRRPLTPPSPFELRIREAAERRAAAERLENNEVLDKQKENQKPLRDRLERQPDGNKPREPFWRAKERQAEREEAERAKADKGDATRPKQHVRAVSDGYPPADPPVNVPQGWGHRNRQRASWLHRSTTEGEGLGLIESVKRVDEDTVLLHKTSFTGDDVDTPLSARRLRQFSSPSSLHHMNTTIQSGAPDIDDLDFDDASVLVSTPAVNTRNRKIDELMKEEVAETERQSTTNQRQSRFSLGGTRGDRPLSAPAGENKPFPRRRRRSDKEKEESAIDEVVEEPRAPTTVTFKDDVPKANGHIESIDLLRKLARASSLSSSPAPDKVVREYPKERRKSSVTKEKPEQDTTNVATVRRRGRDKKASVSGLFTNAPSEAETDPKELNPFSKLAERDPRRISSEPLQPKSALAAIVQEAKSNHDPNIGDSTIASLEDIVNPNLDTSSMNVGVESQAKVENTDVAGSALPSSEENRRREEREFEDANRRLRVARTSIKDADRGLRRLENKLETKESEPAKVVALPVPEPTNSVLPPKTSDTQNRFPGHPPGFRPYTDHNGRTRCSHCGGCYASVWRGMWVEFRELFYTWGPEEAGSPLQLTWIGGMFAVWWAWIFSEWIMSRLFAPYLYGARFPFVTITLIYRIVSEPVESVKWVVEFVGNLVFGDSSTVAEPLAESTSTTSAFIRRAAPTTPMHERASAARGDDGDWVAAAAAATGAATRRVVYSAVEAVDEAASMWDDGYLDL